MLFSIHIIFWQAGGTRFYFFEVDSIAVCLVRRRRVSDASMMMMLLLLSIKELNSNNIKSDPSTARLGLTSRYLLSS